ncbi:hypothetical protein [Brevibacterium linens]|uniref:hypothetical protein n=1 Tax=Brevibacterium linens TaxID=1703 RepID=UPI00356B687D
MFADSADPQSQDSPIAELCSFLAEDPNSLVLRHTPAGADLGADFDVRAVFQQGHRHLHPPRHRPRPRRNRRHPTQTSTSRVYCRSPPMHGWPSSHDDYAPSALSSPLRHRVHRHRGTGTGTPSKGECRHRRSCDDMAGVRHRPPPSDLDEGTSSCPLVISGVHTGETAR